MPYSLHSTDDEVNTLCIPKHHDTRMTYSLPAESPYIYSSTVGQLLYDQFCWKVYKLS